MLEFAKKQYITDINKLKDFVSVTFLLVSDFYDAYTPPQIRYRKGVDRMVMSDAEIITVSIIGEVLSIDSQRAWYNFCRRNLSDLLPHFCERSRFNRNHRNLHSVILNIYKQITRFFCFAAVSLLIVCLAGL